MSFAKHYGDEQIEKKDVGAMLYAYGTREMLKVFLVVILEKTLRRNYNIKVNLKKINEWLWVEFDWIVMA